MALLGKYFGESTIVDSGVGGNALTKEGVIDASVGNLPVASKPPSLVAANSAKVPEKATFMSRSEAEATIREAAKLAHNAKHTVKGYKAAQRIMRADTKVTLAHYETIRVGAQESVKRARGAAEVARVLSGTSATLSNLGTQFEADKKHSNDAVQSAREYLLS